VEMARIELACRMLFSKYFYDYVSVNAFGMKT